MKKGTTRERKLLPYFESLGGGAWEDVFAKNKNRKEGRENFGRGSVSSFLGEKLSYAGFLESADCKRKIFFKTLLNILTFCAYIFIGKLAEEDRDYNAK